MSATTPGLDVRDHLTAVTAALKLLLDDVDAVVGDHSNIPGGNWRPGKKPTELVLLSVDRRIVGARRVTGQAGRSSWRLSVRWASSSENNARLLEYLATQALDETRLVIAAHQSTPLQHESTTPIAFDEGLFSGLTVFTYTL